MQPLEKKLVGVKILETSLESKKPRWSLKIKTLVGVKILKTPLESKKNSPDN